MLYAICATVVLVVLTIIVGKCYRQSSRQKHELSLEQEKWEQRRKWEDIIKESKSQAPIEKELKALQDELQTLRNEISKKMDRGEVTPVDLNRIAMLHLLLTGSKESLSAENLQEEIEKVKKTYEILKDKIS